MCFIHHIAGQLEAASILEGLLTLARKLDIIVRMEHGVGEFVIQELPLVSALGRAPLDECRHGIEKLFTIAPFRTVFQDVEFGIRQMVDIALKALSPSVNDTTTAMNCIDHISAVLVQLARRRVEDPYRVDDTGTLRVLARGPSYRQLLGVAFDEIRRNSRDNVDTLTRMLTRINDVAAATPDAHRRAALREHAELIVRAAQHNVALAEDREPVQLAYERFLAATRADPPPSPKLARVSGG